MVNLLSRVFGEKTPKKPKKPIAEMSLSELIEFIGSGKEGYDRLDIVKVARRFTDIALFDHGVSDGERKSALRLSEELDADLEQAYRGNPDALKAYQEARAHHRDSARQIGYGSLLWKMKDENVEPANLVRFMALEEHAKLLPAYLEMMEPNIIQEIRGPLLDELSRARARGDERPIDVLCRLASDDNGVLSHLLGGTQLSALRRAKEEPGPAELVLRNLCVSSYR